MEESLQDYTAFSTPLGTFKCVRMPMGLTRSPPTFQRLVEKTLVGLTWKNCVPYLDNNTNSSAPKEHVERFQLVFERFHAHILKINPDECDFFRMKVQLFGHMVAKDGWEVDHSKVETVRKFPITRSQTEVKSFLGLSSYYRRYVPKYAEIARLSHKASAISTKFEFEFELRPHLSLWYWH